MNDSNTANIGGAANAPLMENEHVKRLLGILTDNGKDAPGLAALINHVDGLEDFLRQAESRIADMKTQLDTMKEIQNHPIKAALQKTTKALEARASEIRAQIAGLKSCIIEGCKNAATAFKDRGAAALDRLAAFFHLKAGLRSASDEIGRSIELDDKAIAKIAAFSKEYHQTGRHIKNMGRVLVGKQPVDTAKEAGLLAKTISAPYKADKAILSGMKKAVDKMEAKLGQLEKSAEARRGAKSAKPSLEAKLKESRETIRKQELGKPAPARAPKAQGLDI